MTEDERRDQTNRPGPEPERLNLDEDDWHEAVRKALEGKGKKPPEDGPPEGQEDEADDS